MAVPFVALALVLGFRRTSVAIVAGLSVVLVMGGGMRDGLWYVERAWTFVVAGCFVGLTLRRPAASFTRRALAALGVSAAFMGGMLALRSGAWEALDWAVTDRMVAGVSMLLDGLRVIRGGEALSPALVTAFYETVEAQALVFPAMTGIATMAGLAVAWWLYQRLTTGDDQAVGPLREFRFNDHLVWLFIGGLVLLVLRWGDSLARVGSNAVVFMGALYALRGAAVVMFISGGLSLVGYVLLGFGLLFVSPVVLGGAMIIGIGDTWLDIRAKAQALAA